MSNDLSHLHSTFPLAGSFPRKPAGLAVLPVVAAAIATLLVNGSSRTYRWFPRTPGISRSSGPPVRRPPPGPSMASGGEPARYVQDDCPVACVGSCGSCACSTKARERGRRGARRPAGNLDRYRFQRVTSRPSGVVFSEHVDTVEQVTSPSRWFLRTDGVSLGRCGSTDPAVFPGGLTVGSCRSSGNAVFPSSLPGRGAYAHAQRTRTRTRTR